MPFLAFLACRVTSFVVISFLVTWLCGITCSVAAEPPSTAPVIGLAENRPDTFVLANARVVVSPGTVIENANVTIRDGHIVSVDEKPNGTSDEHSNDTKTEPAATRTPGAQIIDMSGKTIYAGFIDGYSEVDAPSIDAGPRHWNPGIMPQRSVADSLQNDKGLNGRLRQVGIVARLAAPQGGQIKGTSALVSTGDSNESRTELRRNVAMHMSLTTDRQRNQYPGSPMGAVALVRQTLYDASWYRDVWQAYNDSSTGLPRPEQNPALDAFAQWLDQKSPIIIDAQNERYALRVAEIAKEFSLPSVIIRGSGREYRRIDNIVATQLPILLPVDFPKAPSVTTPDLAESVSLQQLQHWDLAPENPARLAKAGATIALTTDGMDDKTAFLKSVRIAVKRGLDSNVALAALTTTPAKLFGIESRLGTIESGKLASFVVTDGDLFDDKTKIIETWVAGQRHQIDGEPKIDARGKWHLRFVDLTARPKRAELIITGSADKPKAKARVRNETYEAKKLSLGKLSVGHTLLSCRFSSAGWNQEGLALISLVLTETSLSGAPTTGTLLLPDGTRSTIVAKRIESADDDVQDDEVTDKESEGEVEKDDAENDELDDDEDKDDEDEVNKEDKEDDDEDEDKTNEKNAPALYDVNYPLGAYGAESLPDAQNVLLAGATIWTCGADGIIENGSLLIVDGQIKAVGRGITAPDGVATIDLAGKHLTPGIIDCHSHIATDGGVNEGTQAITAEVRIGDFIDPDDIAIYRQLAGGVTAANVLHGSANPIGGQNQVIKLRWGVALEELKFAGAPAGIKFALGENVKQSNWGESNRTRYPQSRMGVDEIIIDAFERARAYTDDWQRWNETKRGLPPRVDLELQAIAEILAGERWIHCHSYRQSEILALMRTCDAYDITIGSLQHILEGYKLADEMAARGITGSTFSDWWAYKFEVYDAIPYNGALMHEAGVIVSFNSDDAELGRRLNTEAAKAMKYGNVAPDEALKFVTLNPAKQLRIDDRVGSLSVGKDADLVVWSGSPLSSFSRCVQTWIDGRKYFDEQDDQKLRSRDRERHAALVQRILSSGAEMIGPDDKQRDTQEFWTRVNKYCIHGTDDHSHTIRQP